MTCSNMAMIVYFIIYVFVISFLVLKVFVGIVKVLCSSPPLLHLSKPKLCDFSPCMTCRFSPWMATTLMVGLQEYYSKAQGMGGLTSYQRIWFDQKRHISRLNPPEKTSQQSPQAKKISGILRSGRW